MKIYKGDTTIECSTEEFLKIKDDLFDIEEDVFDNKLSLYLAFNRMLMEKARKSEL